MGSGLLLFFFLILYMWFPSDTYWICPEIVEYRSPEFRRTFHAKEVYLEIMKVQMVLKAIRLRKIIKVERTE